MENISAHAQQVRDLGAVLGYHRGDRQVVVELALLLHLHVSKLPQSVFRSYPDEVVLVEGYQNWAMRFMKDVWDY